MNRIDLEQQKIKYIVDHVPNYRKIQPFLDRTSVNEVKRLLHDNGFYSFYRWQLISDTAVRNLILVAQGKKKFISPKAKCKGNI